MKSIVLSKLLKIVISKLTDYCEKICDRNDYDLQHTSNDPVTQGSIGQILVLRYKNIKIQGCTVLKAVGPSKLY